MFFVFTSTGLAWHLHTQAHAPVIPGQGIGRTPSSTAIVSVSSSSPSEVSKKIAPGKLGSPAPHHKTGSPKANADFSEPTTSTPSVIDTKKSSSLGASTTIASPVTLVSNIENAVHVRINAIRKEYGLSTLTMDPTLTLTARAHSEDMLAHGYFSHTNQEGCSFSCRIERAGFSYWSIGENIYSMYGYPIDEESTAAHIVDDWMKSPGHKANIVNPNYTSEGIGIAIRDTTVLATEDLGKAR